MYLLVYRNMAKNSHRVSHCPNFPHTLHCSPCLAERIFFLAAAAARVDSLLHGNSVNLLSRC